MTEQGTKKRGILTKIEQVGNKLPDPTTLFVVLAVLVVAISGIGSLCGWNAVNPSDDSLVEIYNLFSLEGVSWMWSSAISNFQTFAPMCMALVAVIGSAISEKSGFLTTLMQTCMSKASPTLVTAAIVFVGINGNVAGDSAFIIMPPLAAMLFLSMGRSPLLGMFVAYASVAAGFCANLMIGVSDILAFTYTEVAAQIINPDYKASPMINWYFLIVSCILLTVVATVVAEKIVAPRFAGTDLSKYHHMKGNTEVTPEQYRGLRWAGFSFLAFCVLIVVMCIGWGGRPAVLADENGELLSATSPFMSGIIVLVALMFFVPGLFYGIGSGRYKKDSDVWKDAVDGFKDMSGYVLLCFFCAQFTNYFGKSNIGKIIAIRGADMLRDAGLTGVGLLVGILLLSCIVNIFIGSASAKWAILAPVFVPMLMLLGFDPAVAQVAYRIGDSITNPLTPLFSYFPLMLGFVRQYEKDAGIGTITANMLPFSIAFTITWVLQLVVWVLLNLPLGPGGGIWL